LRMAEEDKKAKERKMSDPKERKVSDPKERKVSDPKERKVSDPKQPTELKQNVNQETIEKEIKQDMNEKVKPQPEEQIPVLVKEQIPVLVKEQSVYGNGEFKMKEETKPIELNSLISELPKPPEKEKILKQSNQVNLRTSIPEPPLLVGWLKKTKEGCKEETFLQTGPKRPIQTSLLCE